MTGGSENPSIEQCKAARFFNRFDSFGHRSLALRCQADGDDDDDEMSTTTILAQLQQLNAGATPAPPPTNAVDAYLQRCSHLIACRMQQTRSPKAMTECALEIWRCYSAHFDTSHLDVMAVQWCTLLASDDFDDDAVMCDSAELTAHICGVFVPRLARLLPMERVALTRRWSALFLRQLDLTREAHDAAREKMEMVADCATDALSESADPAQLALACVLLSVDWQSEATTAADFNHQMQRGRADIVAACCRAMYVPDVAGVDECMRRLRAQLALVGIGSAGVALHVVRLVTPPPASDRDKHAGSASGDSDLSLPGSGGRHRCNANGLEGRLGSM